MAASAENITALPGTKKQHGAWQLQQMRMQGKGGEGLKSLMRDERGMRLPASVPTSLQAGGGQRKVVIESGMRDPPRDW